MSIGISWGRSVLFAIALIVAMAQSVVAHPIEPLSGYYFRSDNGHPAIANVDLLAWWEGEALILEMHLFPTQDEIDALLRPEAYIEHVDFEFTLYGLDVTGHEPSVELWKSEFVKNIDEDVVPGFAGPRARVQGFDLNKWVAGEDHVIRLTIHGFATDGVTIPGVEVDMISSSWWPYDGECKVIPDRESINDEDLCALWHETYQLVDNDGDYRLFD